MNVEDTRILMEDLGYFFIRKCAIFFQGYMTFSNSLIIIACLNKNQLALIKGTLLYFLKTCIIDGRKLYF
jgi:hypothetical protein